jgi:hypothetical protein
MTMAMTPARCGVSRGSAMRRRMSLRTRIAARIEVIALSVAMLLLMLYGEQWLLQAPAAADEWIVATCMVDAFDGDLRSATNLCTNDVPIMDEEER